MLLALTKRNEQRRMADVWLSFIVALTMLIIGSSVPSSQAFSMSKEIYGVKGSGWTSPNWNWGYAQGTGHTCAAICREMYLTRESRQTLVENLLQANPEHPSNLEEIKLILALEWQRGRWDGTDGGVGGYGEVLSAMAAARRYEDGAPDDCLRRLVEDMADPARFGLLKPTKDQMKDMKGCLSTDSPEDSFRKCSGLVLLAMGFIERGL